MIGVYRIANLSNGKCYVGSSIDVEKRLLSHMMALRGNNHYNVHLQRAFNKDGESSFSIAVIKECRLFWLRTWEQVFIYELRPEYNKSIWASRVEMTREVRGKISATSRGRRLSEITKQKISIRHTGRKFTAEHRAKLSVAKLGSQNAAGHTVSKDARAVMAAAATGRTKSDETRAKLSASITEWWRLRKERDIIYAGKEAVSTNYQQQ